MTICRREVSPARRPTPDRHARRIGACFVLQEVPIWDGVSCLPSSGAADRLITKVPHNPWVLTHFGYERPCLRGVVWIENRTVFLVDTSGLRFSVR